MNAETNPFPVLRDDGHGTHQPITGWVYGWTLPLVWFVLAVVLFARILWF